MSNPPPPERRRNGIRGKVRRHFLGRHARRDGVVVRRVDFDKDLLMACMAIVIVFLGLLTAFTLYQQKLISDQQGDIKASQQKIRDSQDELMEQQRMLAMLEKRDRVNSYQAAYRFCTRIDVDRAMIHWLATNQLKAMASTSSRARLSRFADRYRSKFERKKGGPILNCEPNVDGESARYWPPSKQREFVRRWDRGELTAAEVGICKIPIGLLTNPRACLKP